VHKSKKKRRRKRPTAPGKGWGPKAQKNKRRAGSLSTDPGSLTSIHRTNERKTYEIQLVHKRGLGTDLGRATKVVGMIALMCSVNTSMSWFDAVRKEGVHGVFEGD